ncbi:MAG: carbohydrate binding domain-containing protein [Treponema sp.]|nr:carbohydrate binding domain-containing protein [Treponema sp.]
MLNIRKYFFVCIFAFGLSNLFSQGLRSADGAFPFNVLDQDEKSLVSCRDLNKEIKNDSPHVMVDENGHLSLDGERFRIFGTNLSGFPEKNQAERNARSLADRGYNCIRFHHTDADWVKCFIKKNPDGKRVIDPVSLDKFDYFVFMLKKYGIYTNLNLLTGRTYTEKDGMPAGTDAISDWKNRHLIGFWNQQARNLQKEYAKALLEHVNPYTGIALKDDPALCIVEINNEQGMIHSYFSNNFYDTPDNLWNEIDFQWNQWLKNQNETYKKLSEKYNQFYPIGKTLIDEKNHWNLENHEGAKASRSGSGNSSEIKITENGKAGWHVQFNSSGLNIQKNQVYTVSFKAKASKKCDISVGLMMAHDPWQNIGWNKNISLDKDWNDYEFVVSGLQADTNARLNFGDMGFLSGTKIEFKDLKMYEGGKTTSVKESSNGVLFPKAGDYGELPEGYKKLVLNFLYDMEKEYWTDMRNYVRNTIGCPALQMGSAMGNMTTGLSMLFDIIDSHAYFNHPSFPGNSWDQVNFYVQNDDLTRQKNSKTLTNLAGFRVFGKPFSVSEYDHPYPNQFSAEMYPMYAAFASFQDWDAIYTFCSDVIEKDDSKNRKISGYFDQTHNPVKTAAAPIASRIFRTGAVPPAKKSVIIELNEEKERENLYKFGSWSVGNTSVFGFDSAMAMKNRTGIKWNDNSCGISDMEEDSEILWEEKKGTFCAAGENAFVFVGRKDSPFYKAKVKQNFDNFEFIPTEDFASVMGVRKPGGEWIFFAGSWSGNKGEQLRDYSQKSPYSSTREAIQRTNVKLTSKPSYMTKDALTLSVSGKLKALKSNYKFTNLSETGLPVEKGNAGKAFESSFELKENSGTLWYLLEEKK